MHPDQAQLTKRAVMDNTIALVLLLEAKAESVQLLIHPVVPRSMPWAKPKKKNNITLMEQDIWVREQVGGIEVLFT